MRHNRAVTQGTFADALAHAEKELWLGLERTGAFAHAGTKGSEREEALAQFLREHLPTRFGVASGEAFDAKRGRSGQLDVVIYDQFQVAPLPAGTKSVLLPAEALLAVIEVKTLLKRSELTKCFRSVKKLAALKPYKDKRFVPARSGGAAAEDANPRCLYTVFAFGTDLGEANWLDKEWERVRDVAREVKAPLELVDRVVVLNRGMLSPPSSVGYATSGGADHELLSEWFVQLTNFLFREARRRPPFEWMPYASKRSGPRVKKLAGWAKAPPAPRRTPAKAATEKKGTSAQSRRRQASRGKGPRTPKKNS